MESITTKDKVMHVGKVLLYTTIGIAILALLTTGHHHLGLALLIGISLYAISRRPAPPESDSQSET